MGDFDAVIIGTGAGGGAAGFALARAGKRVLFVERGIPLAEPSAGRSERRMILGKEGGDDRPLRVNGRKARLQTGGLPGGGTALYGGALLRPAEEDFTPGIFYSRQLPRELWQWPIQYEDLDPWFAQAAPLPGSLETPESPARRNLEVAGFQTLRAPPRHRLGQLPPLPPLPGLPLPQRGAPG
jgi:choline dehydrogenase-like flavoprotein